MPSYLYVWDNGDVSFVSAKTKAQAVDLLDEIGPVDESKLQSTVFAVHLSVEGPERDLLFQNVNEDMATELYSRGYLSEEDDVRPVEKDNGGTTNGST